jgi:hypothetical protein
VKVIDYPTFTLFRLAGHEIGALDSLAATHGMQSLQLVLSSRAGLSEVAFRLAAMAVLSLLYFILGVIFFQRTQMRAAM